MQHLILASLTGILAMTAGHAWASGPGRPVQALAQTQPRVADEASDAAIWIHPSDPAQSVVLTANGAGGLVVHSLDGRELARHTGAEIEHVDVRHGFTLRGSPTALVVGYDRSAGGLVAFTYDPEARRLAPESLQPLAMEAEITGLCLYRSPATGRLYAFAAGGDGSVQQWELFERQGRVDGHLVRRFPVGAGAAYCVVDDENGALYMAEETVGIWKLAAEPETDPVREPFDLVAPRGSLAGEVKGLALYRADDARAWLLAVDVDAGRINVYGLDDAKLAGAVRIAASGRDDVLEEAEGLAATSLSLSEELAGGLIVVADEGKDGQPGNYKLVAWRPIAEALGLPRAPGRDPRFVPAMAGNLVEPTVETEPVQSWGDAADDPAIWVHPEDPALSLIIGTDKKRGLYVYDLSGRTLQTIADGRMNNVDVRQGVRLGDRTLSLVAATNRTTKTIALYRVDESSRRLERAGEPIPTGFTDPYGLCLYRSPKNGQIYVFASDGSTGRFRQWRLSARKGRIEATLVREFEVGSQSEGCAADDETGALYVTEEDVGLWRYSAEPDGGSERVAVDTTEQGHLVADVEGVAIYYGANGTGYVIVSSQGSNDYAVYRREGKNEYVGRFSVVSNGVAGVDGASETDGLDVVSTPLGPAFPYGVLVVQDGRNLSPPEKQNFKLVPWERIAAALSLNTHTGWNPHDAAK